MKFETLMLQGLFAACLLICVLTLGAMLSAQPGSDRLASQAATPAASLAD